MVPVLLRVKPDGRLPEYSDHAAPDSLAVRVAADMVIVRVFVAEVVPLEALKVKLNVPAEAGVPEIVPFVVRVRPEGRLSELTNHVTPETPAVRAAL